MNAPARVRDFLRLSFGRIGHEVFHGPVSGRPAAADRLRGAVPGHADANERLPAGSGPARADAELRLGDPVAHPSGVAEPSRADQILTRELQNALKLVDVQVLDHIIVAAADSVSFAELGLL